MRYIHFVRSLFTILHRNSHAQITIPKLRLKKENIWSENSFSVITVVVDLFYPPPRVPLPIQQFFFAQATSSTPGGVVLTFP
eukprot:UN25130